MPTKNEHNIEHRLLYELDKNSRASFASIGRTIHRSAQEVKRQYDNMREKGIIQYCFPLIEYRALNYFFIIYLLKLHNLTKDSEEEFYRYLNATNALPVLMRGDGYCDVILGIFAPGMRTAERVFHDINSRFTQYIMSYETVIPTGTYKFNRAYLLQKPEVASAVTLTEEEIAPRKIKDDALRVLEVLNRDARTSFQDIARELHISYDRAKYTVKKLEELGVIKGYTYLLNHDRLGFPRFRVHFQLRGLSRPRERTLFEYCNAHPNIVHYLRLLGGWQLALDIEIKNRDELRELLREMKARFSDMIVRVEPTHLYQIDRYRDLPIKLTWTAPVVS